MDKVNSQLIGLDEVVGRRMRFNIPRYQRLYVWEDEQVKTLFNDILTASISGKDLYFLGTIILVERGEDMNTYDLVDGQQRFTTLWLLTNELGGRLQAFTKVDGNLRLLFSIRPMVKKYFTHLSSENNPKNDANDIEFADLERISKARHQLRSLIGNDLKEPAVRKVFEEFLWTKLKVVATVVPPSSDLNKLFEALNNRGEQLAQHEILKARILARLKSGKERYAYGKLWSACSDMENYLERALAKEVGSAWKVAGVHDSSWFQSVTKVLDLLAQGNTETSQEMSLSQVLKRTSGNDEARVTETQRTEDEHPETDDEEKQPVRSILTFSQLLLHVLRIFLHRKDHADIQRINEKELLDVFTRNLLEAKDESGADLLFSVKDYRAFIELLFEVREVFDTFVIKWVRVSENEEVHLIKDLKKQNQKKGGWTYYLRRQKTNRHDGFALLQSMLYHSQQNTTQYWLTPLLNRLCYFDSPDFESAYLYLKRLDNVLFSTGREHMLLTERTKECLHELPDYTPTTEPYNGDDGTDFSHYLFYKLEFVLWHERERFNKPEWSAYRMTAKNSVEHVSPQNPRYATDKLCETETDRMGNLVLVTRSINSEYGDKSFGEKKEKHAAKRTRGEFDSLKSVLIYDHPTYGDEQARKHSEKMMKVLMDYFETTLD